MAELTICGVPLDLLRKPPTTAELANLLAEASAQQQAEFLAAFASRLRDKHGSGEAAHFDRIASFARMDDDDWARGLIAELASAMSLEYRINDRNI